MECELPNERPARQVLVESMAMSKDPVKALFLQIIPGYTENPGKKALLQTPKDQRQTTQSSSALGYDCNSMEGGSRSGWDGSWLYTGGISGSNYPEGFGAGGSVSSSTE